MFGAHELWERIEALLPRGRCIRWAAVARRGSGPAAMHAIILVLRTAHSATR